MIEAKEIFTASLVLFAVIDIVGNIPLVISLKEKVGHSNQKELQLYLLHFQLLQGQEQ